MLALSAKVQKVILLRLRQTGEKRKERRNETEYLIYSYFQFILPEGRKKGQFNTELEVQITFSLLALFSF